MNMEALQTHTRERLFVGRGTLLGEFQRMLARRDTPRVLYVSGPAGIGKTCLLRAFQDIAEKSGCPFTYLDARRLAADPAVIRPVAARVLAPDPEHGAPPRPRVLAVDHVGSWSNLVDWLRSNMLPRLPDHALLVIARRLPPSPEWWADPNLHPWISEWALGPLGDAAARRYLRHRGLAGHQHRAVLDYAQGHPLALAMAASYARRAPAGVFDPFDEALDHAIAAWLERDLSEPPRPGGLAGGAVPALSEPVVWDAVLDALRHYQDPTRLVRNPLLASRLLRRESGAIQPGPEDLRRVLWRISQAQLDQSASPPTPARVLTLAYFHPQGKQYAVADSLNVSERTFRRYLRQAERRLARLWWVMESGQWRPDRDAPQVSATPR